MIKVANAILRDYGNIWLQHEQDHDGNSGPTYGGVGLRLPRREAGLASLTLDAYYKMDSFNYKNTTVYLYNNILFTSANSF